MAPAFSPDQFSKVFTVSKSDQTEVFRVSRCSVRRNHGKNGKSIPSSAKLGSYQIRDVVSDHLTKQSNGKGYCHTIESCIYSVWAITFGHNKTTEFNGKGEEDATRRELGNSIIVA